MRQVTFTIPTYSPNEAPCSRNVCYLLNVYLVGHFRSNASRTTGVAYGRVTVRLCAAEPAELVPELVPELVRQLVLLRLEEDELESSGRELRSRLAAERTEIGRLRDTIREMETLYKYR